MSFFKNSFNPLHMPCLCGYYDEEMTVWKCHLMRGVHSCVRKHACIHVHVCLRVWRSQIICRLLKMFISLHNTNQTARQTSSVQIHFIATLLRREEAQYKTWFKVSLTFFSQQFQSSIQHCISLQNIILALLLWLPLPSFEIASFPVLW